MIITSDVMTKTSNLSVNDTSRIVIDGSKVMLQIVESLTGDSRNVTCDCNVFLVQAIDVLSYILKWMNRSTHGWESAIYLSGSTPLAADIPLTLQSNEAPPWKENTANCQAKESLLKDQYDYPCSKELFV